MSPPRSWVGVGVAVVGLGDAVVVVVSGAGLAVVVVSWRVCSAVVIGAVVVSWARADVSRLVSCHPTHTMSGVEISKARISGLVPGLCHRTTGSLLLSTAYILSVMSREGRRGAVSARYQARAETAKARPQATDKGKMHEDERSVDPTGNEAGSLGDLTFIIFSLAHAGCGGEGVIELRLGERSLLGWCPSCAVLETFGSFDGWPGQEVPSTEK